MPVRIGYATGSPKPTFLSFCVALFRREFTGLITPRIGWLHCAANQMALYGREMTKTDLEALGHEVWVDNERIEFWQQCWREITEGIHNSQIMAALGREFSVEMVRGG